MDYGLTCCFTGHRPQALPSGGDERAPACVRLKDALRREIAALVQERGVTHFISGMAQGIDQWAAGLVAQLRGQYPHLSLEGAVPCAGQESGWSRDKQLQYHALRRQCDRWTILQPAYTRGCMQARNRYMVDNSDIVLAVWDGRPGGTGSTVAYARKRGRCLLILDPVTAELVSSGNSLFVP